MLVTPSEQEGIQNELLDGMVDEIGSRGRQIAVHRLTTARHGWG